MILLGSTGSIGINTLEVARTFCINVESLSAGRNITLLNSQIKEFLPKNVCIADPKDEARLDCQFLKKHNIRLYTGDNGLLELIAESESHLVVNALVGYAGLAPSLQAQRYKKKLALANKESLVVAGWLLGDYELVPVDSEHFGLWYLLRHAPLSKNIKQLFLTASGGALRDMPLENMYDALPSAALAHPNWSMGKKITIDSATMVNKLFEVLEAFWLFKTKNIDALIEKKSLIHALAEFHDGSILAHISNADMKLPIAYALDSQKAAEHNLIDCVGIGALANLTFSHIDTSRYPLWNLKEQLLESPKLGIVLNASNEIAVDAFLHQQIPFGKIAELIFFAIEHFYESKDYDLASLKDIQALDHRVREFCKQTISSTQEA